MTQITLDRCRGMGWKADVVERRVARRVTKDAFGIGDILAVDCEGRAYLIQVTDNTHHATRARKIRERCTENAAAWCKGSNVIEVWSYKRKKGSRTVWDPEPRVERVEVT